MEVESLVDVVDHEIPMLLEVIGDLNSKYATRTASPENFQSLSSEAVDRFAKIGFVVSVNPFSTPPVITIEARTPEKPYDLERAVKEAKEGVADDFWEKKRKQEQAKRRPRNKPGPEHKH